MNCTESRIFARIPIVKSVHVVRHAAKEDRWMRRSLSDTNVRRWEA